jgi:small multidrug resistance family-3 protein
MRGNFLLKQQDPYWHASRNTIRGYDVSEPDTFMLYEFSSEELVKTYLVWLIFIGAAVLEVGGDAVVRKGLRGGGLRVIFLGAAMLGFYGVVINTVKWDFSRLLGVYVAMFALVSLLFGRLVFKENASISTWIGLSVIIAGGLIIQFGDNI